MTRAERTSRPLPISLATLAALVAILAAASNLPDGAVIERSRGWIIRPIDGDDTGPISGRSLTDCLAQAARHLLGGQSHMAAAIAPLHSLHTSQATVPAVLRIPENPSWPPAQRVVVSHLALPPPRA